MKFDFKESRIISNGNTNKYNIAQCDNRAAVGLAWTGRHVILDEALNPCTLLVSYCMYIIGYNRGICL